MSILRASLISTAIADCLGSGRVHSVFARAANVVFADRLVTLARLDGGGLPNGVLLEREVNFLSLGLEPGQAVLADTGALSVPALGLIVDLNHARPWSPLLRARGRPRPLHDVLAGCPPLAPLPERAHDPMQRLVRATRAQHAAAMADAARGLLGLGAGLTPSGDDVLLGFGAVLRYAEHPLADAFCFVVAEAAAGRTTDVSVALLRHAARAEYPERLLHLLDALAPACAPSTLRHALTEAAQTGATSGQDTIHGVLLALSTCTLAHCC